MQIALVPLPALRSYPGQPGDKKPTGMEDARPRAGVNPGLAAIAASCMADSLIVEISAEVNGRICDWISDLTKKHGNLEAF